MTFPAAEQTKLQTYLQTRLNPRLTLKPRSKSDDSLEVLLDGEYLGTVYRDAEDGDVSYDVNLSVLAIDLDDAA